MHVVLDGNLPAALLTSSGPISAPDPRDAPAPAETRYGAAGERDEFWPDRDTRATDSRYDDPFTPTTAPFKRMTAFDAVRGDYKLYIRNPAVGPVAAGPPPKPDDDAFFMDAVVDLSPGRRVRIPSVGPGARTVGGSLRLGAQNADYAISRDGADNWYVEGLNLRTRAPARLVLEVAISRATFGGPLADMAWSDMLPVPPLPANVVREAEQVSAAIGVSRGMRPREAVAKLVGYFRGFSESSEPIARRASVYLDLALSKTGVCRHRSFAFMVTALALGIPARLVENEVHAWVEVHDGVSWRRIDLGGAGHMTPDPNVEEARQVYRPPTDAFPWPLGATPSDAAQTQGGGGANAGAAVNAGANAGPGAPIDPRTAPSAGAEPSALPENRPASSISLTWVEDAVRRGNLLHARGEVRAPGEACARVGVEVILRDRRTQRLTALGTLATGDDGTFSASIVVPGSTPTGDYDLVARTAGNAQCGPGQN